MEIFYDNIQTTQTYQYDYVFLNTIILGSFVTVFLHQFLPTLLKYYNHFKKTIFREFSGENDGSKCVVTEQNISIYDFQCS